MSRQRSVPSIHEERDRERDSDSGPSSIADVRARVRLGRVDIAKIFTMVFQGTAVLSWGAFGVAVVQFAPVAVRSLSGLTEAMTRASVALDRASDATARVEATTTELRSELREARAEQRAQGARLEALLQGCGRR